MPQYRELTESELSVELFDQFERKQVVTDCRRKVDGEWRVLADPGVDDWTPEDYEFLVSCLKRTVETGGVVWGAFVDGVLKGFASVERKAFGSESQYMELTSLHVSNGYAPMRHRCRALLAQRRFRAQPGYQEALYLLAFGGGDAGVLQGHGLRRGNGVQR